MNECIINLELSVEETNIILNALSQRPYFEVSELIEKIRFAGEKQIALFSEQCRTDE